MAKVTNDEENNVKIVTDKSEVDTALILGKFDGPIMWNN